MGSTGELDRKRRLSSSFAPGAAAVAPAKRPALPPCSDDKKDLISKHLAEIKRLHEVRIEILNKLATFQNTLTDFKSISSSKAFQVLNDQLQKSQEELDHSQTLLEKLQVDKDKLIWQEREINVKVDLAEIPHRVSAPCRSQIISEFKALVSSLPREMGAMESKQSKYKGDASELHSLRAEVHSLSDILTRKEHAINESLRRSTCAGSEIKDLQSRVNSEFKLFAEMHKRESTDSRDIGCLCELLKSKHEEGEAYPSEIGSIAQAYEDIQTQNQQLVQQIIER